MKQSSLIAKSTKTVQFTKKWLVGLIDFRFAYDSNDHIKNPRVNSE
jgi:hypothetical protein